MPPTANALTPVLAALALTIGNPSARASDAAPVAQYEVTFESFWSAETHPIDPPGNPHFSGMIGGTHTDAIAFWEVGALASHGIEEMAEHGTKTVLRLEVIGQIGLGHAGSVIEGNGFMSPGQRSTTFEIAQEFPLATVVSMIAPSPDWFVGTSGLPLFVDDHWRPAVDYVLLPYDAGTDSGTTHTSSSQDTVPAEPISAITGFPFAKEGEPVAPLGVFRFRRVDAPPCPADLDDSGAVTVADLLTVIDAWGPCAECAADVDGDGIVGTSDLLAVLSTWGACG